MRISSSQQKFLDSDVAASAKTTLQSMVGDDQYNTTASYTTTMDRKLSFVEKHLRYLSDHPKLDPRHYLANLRLKTKIRR